MTALDQPGNSSSPLPMLATLACALPGMLLGLTLSEILESSNTLWSGLFWIPMFTGAILGIALATMFSPRYQFTFVRPFERILTRNLTRIIAAGAALGLAVTVLALLVSVAASVWPFNWTIWWLCVGTSPIYGTLAGLAVINMDAGKNAR